MGRNKKVTIADIAEKARVSKSTVSRVLNDSDAVVEEKRTAVLDAIAELDYQPNLFARGLAGGQTMTIGILTQDITSPHNDALLHGVLDALSGTGYSPIIADGSWQAEREKEAIQILLGRQVDGLIVLGGEAPELFLQQVAQNVPLIIVGRHLDGLAERCLYIDNFTGAYKATKYLVDMGHRRIAYMTGRLDHPDGANRRKGYLQALQDAGLEVDPALIVEGNFTEQSGVVAMEMLFNRSRSFSAIFTGNDQMAFGVRLALFRRGIRVPDDMSIIGFDDQHGSAYMTPPLTTVHQPVRRMGKAAAEAMLHLVKNEPYALPRLPMDLIIRESVRRLL
ncbi:MAG: LacI family DNA-binding transcriptional regulator [Ardenticatenaceae bacterium]|nr:LacI family DNA-binding transcriptional regulator [Ardenticatenaceae bacterium]